MIRPPASDFWRTGLVPMPIAAWLEPPAPEAIRPKVVWLPDPGPWRYLADPFGVRRDDAIHVFVEAYDYRTRQGLIEHHEFGPDLAWRGRSVALAEASHLSYPFVVDDRGEVFLVPESQRAREVALYRAQRFPHGWVRETALLRGVPAAEPSLIRHDGRWWMFFTVVGPHARDQRELHVAHAPSLTGPWRLHSRNPVLVDRAGARPGGTPFIASDGTVRLPVQDCSNTYGGAIRFLRFGILEPDRIAIERVGPRITGDLVSASHHDGCHTLSACGNLTLIDAKRTIRTWARWAVDLRRRVDRLRGLLGGSARIASPDTSPAV